MSEAPAGRGESRSLGSYSHLAYVHGVAEQNQTSNVAVFIDLENLAIGASKGKLKVFDYALVQKRLVDKGNVVARRAYADWGRFESYKRSLHEAGVQLIEMPGRGMTGKNSADIKMVVDALELAHTKPHIDTFALVTGDSDFSPLVAQLRENNRFTICVGIKSSTSSLLVDSCDEFIFYDDLVRSTAKARRPSSGRVSKKTQAALDLLLESAAALQRENRVLHSSLVKQTMKRKQPQFNEEYHGYSSFSRLLEDAQKRNLISLTQDARSGTYLIANVHTEEG